MSPTMNNIRKIQQKAGLDAGDHVDHVTQLRNSGPSGKIWKP